MANEYEFIEGHLNITVQNAELNDPFNYSVTFGNNYTSGVITRQEDKNKWSVIKDETPPEIKCIAGTNTFTLEFDTNKEVILTESAVKQLVKNIKDADKDIKDNYIPKSTLSGAYDIMYSSAANIPAKLAANTTTTKKFLRMTGTGSAGAAPAWDTVTKSDVGLGNVENTKLSTWTGSTAITKLGDISTGTIPWANLSEVPNATKQGLGVVSIGNNIDINNGEISVPAATAGENEENGINGVVTTGEQAFGGIKIFSNKSGIYTPKPDSNAFRRKDDETGEYVYDTAIKQQNLITFYNEKRARDDENDEITVLGAIGIQSQFERETDGENTTIKGYPERLVFYQRSYNGITKDGPNKIHERYSLPAVDPDLTEPKYYKILTTKTSKNVSVAPPDKDTNDNELPGIKLHFDSNQNTATVSVTGVTTFNTVIVSPVANDANSSTGTMSSWEVWRDAGVRCTGQSAGTLTFTADETPGQDTYFNVIILG